MAEGSGGASQHTADGDGFAPPDGSPDLQGSDTAWAWLSTVITSPLVFLQNYGWLVVAIVLVCYLVWTRVRGRFYELYDRTMEKRELANTDEATVVARQNAQAVARDRMQREMDERTRAFVEKQKVNDEKKRQEKVEDWDRHQRGEGYRSRVKKADEAAKSDEKKTTKKRTLRDSDYNPLAGGASGGGGFSRASGRHTFRSSGGG